MDKEREIMGSIHEGLSAIRESMKDVQDTFRVLPVELKASRQGRKPHKNEILMQFSIRELKDAIKLKKEMNKKRVKDNLVKRRR